MRGRFLKAIFLMAAAALSGCTTIYNPATERTESYFFSTAQEVGMGRDMDVEIRKKMRVIDDPRMRGRLEAIGRRVALASDRQDLSYTFHVINDDELNAFAVPGGYIYVNSGLMNVSTDDELACVLAHEIGHVAARHSVKKLQTALGYQLVLNIALGISGQYDVGKAVDVMFNLTSLGYSRQDELLADKLAVRYSKRAGYDPAGMISFFEKLKEETRTRGAPLRVEFLSSHPDLDKRIERVQQEISQLR